MDGPGNPFKRIWQRMDNRRSERSHILRVQLFGSMSRQAPLGPTEESIQLAARIDADDGPHAMIMRLEYHARPPTEVEDGQVIRFVDRINASAFRLAKDPHQLRGLAYGPPNMLGDCGPSVLSLDCSTAIFDKVFLVKHGQSLPFSQCYLSLGDTTFTEKSGL